MAGLTLPEASSRALRETVAGLLFRVLARAAVEDRWTDWDAHLEAEREGGTATPPDGAGWLEALRGEAAEDARDAVGHMFCDGLGHYLEALAPRERVRSSGRVAKLLHEVTVHTGLAPFAQLGVAPEQDQASIWEAVLRVLLSQAQGEGLDPSWLAHLRALPKTLERRWREQLDMLPLSSASRGRIETALRPPPPAPLTEPEPDDESAEAAEPEAAEPEAAADDDRQLPGELLVEVPVETVEVEGVEVFVMDVRPEALPDPLLEAALEHDVEGALDEALERSLSGTFFAVPDVASATPERVDVTAIGTLDDLEDLDDQTLFDDSRDDVGASALPDAGDAASAEAGAPGDEGAVEEATDDDEAEVADLDADQPAEEPAADELDEEPVAEEPAPDEPEDAVEDEAAPAPAARESVDTAAESPTALGIVTGAPPALEGGFAGKPLPRALRVAGVLTGLIVVVSVARLLLRFLLGYKRTARLWVEDDNVYLESTTHFLGREMRRERRSFGPRGLLSVAREVRYPYIYTFLGLVALCAGTLVGTIVFLDGRLAGFEDWMRLGLYLILGALVLDFLLTVVAATRPGRTSLTLTFEPKTTCRVLGVPEADADRMLEALTRMANR